jgi:predicted DNA-binding protein (UPF0278 family)
MLVRREVQEGVVEKTQLHVYVPKHLDEELRAFIARKYGTFERGLLSHEVANAIEAWLRTHKTTQEYSIRAPNPIPKVQAVRMQVQQYLRDELGYVEIYQVPLRHISEALGVVRGTDSRTIRKWVETFRRYGVIKEISPYVVEFL